LFATGVAFSFFAAGVALSFFGLDVSFSAGAETRAACGTI
jgi:hypothetical protein